MEIILISVVVIILMVREFLKAPLISEDNENPFGETNNKKPTENKK